MAATLVEVEDVEKVFRRGSEEIHVLQRLEPARSRRASSWR